VPSPGRSGYDPRLGVVPKPGLRSATVNIDADGNRRMPPFPDTAPVTPTVLVTGDSYAFGLDVGDAETLPAYLQDMMWRPFSNAGVPGFGLDQIMLRSEQLAPIVHPSALIVTFIADDIWRTEFSRLWSSDKPWFSLADNGTLVLHNVPVPPPGNGESGMSAWQRLFGWSWLVETVMRRIGRDDDWIWDHRRVLPSGYGERLACPLMQRLAKIGVQTLVVAQYDHSLWQPGRDKRRAEHRRLSTLVLACAHSAGMPTLDTFDLVERAIRKRGFDALYIGEHHTPLANRLIAKAIVAELIRLGY